MIPKNSAHQSDVKIAEKKKKEITEKRLARLKAAVLDAVWGVKDYKEGLRSLKKLINIFEEKDVDKFL